MKTTLFSFCLVALLSCTTWATAKESVFMDVEEAGRILRGADFIIIVFQDSQSGQLHCSRLGVG